jgi:hypothetical protein
MIELTKVVDEIKGMRSLTDTILIARFHFQLINPPFGFHSMLASNKKQLSAFLPFVPRFLNFFSCTLNVGIE